MARPPSVWYWKARKKYYTTINGKRIPLSGNKKEAEQKFYELMAASPSDLDRNSVIAILDDFLTWNYENRAKRTADRYKDFCADFCKSYGTVVVSQLTPAHVTDWLNNHPTWNTTTKANALTALQRGFNWAVRNRGLTYNPIKGMEKPKRQRRTTVVAEEDFDWLLKQYETDDPFRDLLIVSWDSGCRPQEIRNLTADQVDLKLHRAVISEDAGAKRGITRAIYIPTKRAQKIIKKLTKERPEGPLFLNTRGNAWTAYAINCRFQKLKKKTGKKFHHYALRHTFITEKLKAGVDSHIVAELSGHTSTKMLDQVYSHIAQDAAFMLKQAKKGTKK